MATQWTLKITCDRCKSVLSKRTRDCASLASELPIWLETNGWNWKVTEQKVLHFCPDCKSKVS